ncbi:MAG: hypothetical protein A4E66_01109 [Syntrophus sp. PtaB.Bin001]|nr:MAG: hypothetical protein A4E66_01109 [Syntrophus sp. PtaB.Bin001]
MKTEKLFIFDYSGTLSLQSVLFGRRDSLQSALEKSGLASLGVTPSMFWEEIVNPTWLEGSTTPIGYKRVLLRRLREETGFPHPGNQQLTDEALQRAAAAFVDSYLKSSRMEESWRPLLRKLLYRRDVCTIIATDHYAEATPAILKFLAEWDLPALPANETYNSPRPAALIVANSADLGAHKASACFWQKIKSGLDLQNLQEIFLVDDFGYNEQEGDAYGEAKQVEKRLEQTTRLLRDVFGVAPSIFRFFLERKNDPRTYEELMVETASFIDSFLERKI